MARPSWSLPTGHVGLTAAMLLAVLLATGAPMALRYEPQPDSAHASVRAIAGMLGGFVRSLHSWAASLLVAVLLVHMSRAWMLAEGVLDFRRRWTLGTVALGLVLILFLLGTVLAWDQRAWEAFQHVQGGASTVGVDVGGPTPSDTPLRPLFLLHVLGLPAVLLAVLYLHLRRPGGLPIRQRLRALLPPARRLLAAAGITLVASAALFPPFLGPQPIAGLEVSRPAWPFLWLVPLQDWWGATSLWLAPATLVVVASFPWVTKGLGAKTRNVVALGALAAFFVLTVLALT